MTYSGAPITLGLKDAAIRDVIDRFGQFTGINFIVDNDVTGSVSVNFLAVPWDQVLDAFLQQNGLTRVVEGKVIRIARLDTLVAEKQKERRLRELTRAEER